MTGGPGMRRPSRLPVLVSGDRLEFGLLGPEGMVSHEQAGASRRSRWMMASTGLSQLRFGKF